MKRTIFTILSTSTCLLLCSIFLVGCNPLSKMNTAKASAMYEKNGADTLSVDKMVDLIEDAANVQSADAYVLAKDPDDIKKLCNSGFGVDISAKLDSALFGISGDNRYMAELYALDFKTKEYADRYMSDWMGDSSLKGLTDLANSYLDGTKLTPEELGEEAEDTQNGISYYMVEYDLNGNGCLNIAAIYKSDKNIYILTSNDDIGSTKGQRQLDNMCSMLNITTPSEVLSHSNHQWASSLTTTNNANDGYTSLSASECGKAFNALCSWIAEHPTFVQSMGYLSAYGNGKYKYNEEYKAYAYKLTIMTSTGKTSVLTFASYNAPTDGTITIIGDGVGIDSAY